jgi:hypothetical protein
MTAALPVVTFRVGRSYLVVVSGTGGQASKSYLMARDHCRINGRTVSIGRDGSIIDCGVRGNVRCPNDLSGGGCWGRSLYARNFQSRRGIAIVTGATHHACAADYQNRHECYKRNQYGLLHHIPFFGIWKRHFRSVAQIYVIATH